jgi:ABC-type branched-subunit amino acid transport system ATPase component
MTTALLSAEDLAAGYTGRPVIRGVNVSVTPGEIVGILGANGAGKSTTLRALVGEIAALKGRVEWKGQVTRKPLYARVREGLGYVPEDRSVFPDLTVEENLRVGRGSVEGALEYFPELVPNLKRRAGLLSGGQQQMVTLGRVLAAGPEVLVVDELSQGLAPILVRRLFTALEEAAQRGVGIILVEQHARLAIGIANRVLVMRRGLVVREATRAEVLADTEDISELYFGREDDV